jgi:UDP-N-acetyl-D-glucosamine dehydrogenase
MKGSKVLVLGLAYKADIDDVRESPSFELIQLLEDRGARADYSDPLVPETWAGRKHDLQKKSVALTAASLASYDLVVVSTAHSAFDWNMIAKNSKLILDTRDAMRAHHSALGDRLMLA